MYLEINKLTPRNKARYQLLPVTENKGEKTKKQTNKRRYIKQVKNKQQIIKQE